jgi:ABC-2 type transport system ATP-binding protein
MIEVIELKKSYGEHLVLKNISFLIEQGTFWGLVGPNGAGKTTLINLLCGASKPNSGRINVMGFDITKNEGDIKKNIGVLPEGLALFDGLTGYEQLTFVGKVYGLEKKINEDRISELLNLLDLRNDAHKMIETYSQGMKKKLSFAASILHDPKVLFLDEPFENIDPLSRKIMKNIMVSLLQKGVTIIITSHSLELVENLCTEIAIINKGDIVYRSKTVDIRNKIKNELTRETYQSLEEIFIDVVSDNKEEYSKGKLSWL